MVLLLPKSAGRPGRRPHPRVPDDPEAAAGRHRPRL